MIVMHATVGGFYSSLSWLCNPQSNVSTHYLIAKNGAIYRLVEESEAAWHAGKSAWHGLDSDDIQKQSIGIELTNANDGVDPYPTVQVEQARLLCADLIARYHITAPMFTRHLDIAIPPGRKTDPAGFDWAPFVASLYTPIRMYRPIGIPIYQQQRLSGPLAGHLTNDADVAINMTYVNNAGHLASGQGFVDLAGFEVLP